MRKIKCVPGHTSLIDVIDRVLDRGIVFAAWERLTVAGIDLITVETRVVITSMEPHLHPYGALAAQSAGLPTR